MPPINQVQMEPFVSKRESSESTSKQLADKIAKMIGDGQFGANGKLPNHSELASMLRVSARTVQHAMNELVRQGLISRTRGLGTFVASVPKATTARSKLALVFLHQPDTEADHEWGQPSSDEWCYIRAALKESIRLKFQLVIDSWEHLAQGGSVPDLARHFDSDGNYELILFFNTRFQNLPVIEKLANSRRGVVIINGNSTVVIPTLSCVNVDFLPAAQQAAERLKELGHRRIVCLGGDEEDVLVRQARTEAIGKAVSASGLEMALVRSAEEFAAILDAPARPTAVWESGASPKMYEQYPVILKNKGLQVPQDLSLISISKDRLAPSGNGTYSAACLVQPSESLVRVAIHALIASGGAPVHVFLPAEFFAGTSLAPPRQTS